MRLTAPHSSPITRRNFGVLAAAWFVFVSIPVDPSYSQAQEGVAAKPGDEIIVEFKGKRKRARVRRTVNITMDINHDGRIDKKDDNMEDEFSAVVIRDFDDVYVLRKDEEDKTKENDEPARRQLLVVQEDNPALDSIAIERSSRNILIFKSATGNDELIFGNKRSHIVPPGRYWVQGGKNYSKTVGAEFLIAHPRQWQKRLGPPPSNKISLTVMWLDLEVRIGPGDHILKKPLFEDFENVKKAQGHDLLGVQRSRKDSEDKEQKVRAIAEIRGIVHPSKIVARNAKGRNENAFGKRDLTTGLWRS